MTEAETVATYGPDEIERVGWNEALHPRQGGKFAKKGTSSAPAAKNDNQALSYNGRTGAGYGSKAGDNRVHALQSQLNRLGLTDTQGHPLKLDGKLGPRTTAAIKKAQRALGMKPTGVATPALLAKLSQTKSIKGKTVAKPVRRPKVAAKKAAPAKKAAAPAKVNSTGRKTNYYSVATANKRT